MMSENSSFSITSTATCAGGPPASLVTGEAVRCTGPKRRALAPQPATAPAMATTPTMVTIAATTAATRPGGHELTRRLR